MPGLVTKCSVVQKVDSRQTFTNILNLHCDLDLEHSNPIFPQDIPASDAVYYQTKFSDKMLGSLENIGWINNDILTLHCDIDLECSNLFFSQDTGL